MNKSVLLSILFIPTILGCNNNVTPGFDNPFPDDEYVKSQKVGFNLANDEQITRALSTKEISGVRNTYTKRLEFDKYIKKETIERHERNYIRAFAGEFKQGYSSSNVLKDETVIIERASTDENNTRCRKKTNSSSTSINDYSYGRISNNVQTTTQRYFMALDSNEEIIEEDNDKSTEIHDRVKTIENQIYNKTIDLETEFKKEDSKKTDPWDNAIIENAFGIKQSDYLSEPDVNSGARVESGVEYVVLYKETKEEYQSEEGTKGVYELKDGRKFRAMNNSIQVTKLKLIATPKEEDDYYLVSYVRKYTETVITSKEIEPNVQITMLKQPVVISFVEEKHYFDIVENHEVAIEALNAITPEKTK